MQNKLTLLLVSVLAVVVSLSAQVSIVPGTVNVSTLSALGTGLLKSTTGTGALSIATASDLPSGTGLTANPLSQFAATTSAQLAGVISDETGSGPAVFATSPTLVTPNIGVASGTSLNVTGSYQINGVALASAVVCSNTAVSTTITSSNAKTYVSINCKVSANSLSAGKTLKLLGRGIYSGNATDTLVMTLEACQISGCATGTKVTLATTSALTLLALSNQFWNLDEQLVAFTIGASGTVDTQGFAAFETAATTMVFDATPNTSTATIDTTADQYLSISVTFSTASASDSLTMRNFTVVIQ